MHDPTQSSESNPDKQTSTDNKTLDEALEIISQSLLKGKRVNPPDHLASNEVLVKLLDYISEMQQNISDIRCGNLSANVSLKGFTGGMLKAVQSNLRHFIWKSDRVSSGEFSQQIDFMGELSESFNAMVNDLRQARGMLEEQKSSLVQLSEDLLREISARIAAEKGLRREEERQRELALTDALTGTLNRRGFMQSIRKEVSRMCRSKASVCLALLDLDYFKEVNDTHGHQAGDEALCAVARVLLENLRDYDTVGRYGGDEFIILLPETTLEDAYSILERICRKVDDEKIPKGCSVHVKISGGVTLIDTEEDCDAAIDEAVNLADKAMYASKRNGRNQITMYRPDLVEEQSAVNH